MHICEHCEEQCDCDGEDVELDAPLFCKHLCDVDLDELWLSEDFDYGCEEE